MESDIALASEVGSDVHFFLHRLRDEREDHIRTNAAEQRHVLPTTLADDHSAASSGVDNAALVDDTGSAVNTDLSTRVTVGGKQIDNSPTSNKKPADKEARSKSTPRHSEANNPKLLDTVEDAIRRLILPGISELKPTNRQDAERKPAPVSYTLRGKAPRRTRRAAHAHAQGAGGEPEAIPSADVELTVASHNATAQKEAMVRDARMLAERGLRAEMEKVQVRLAADERDLQTRLEEERRALDMRHADVLQQLYSDATRKMHRLERDLRRLRTGAKPTA